jgi:hypothetical protein
MVETRDHPKRFVDVPGSHFIQEDSPDEQEDSPDEIGQALRDWMQANG